MQELSDTLKNIIQSNVAAALAEDIGTGDITGMLIPEKTLGKAKLSQGKTAYFVVEHGWKRLSTRLALK